MFISFMFVNGYEFLSELMPPLKLLSTSCFIENARTIMQKYVNLMYRPLTNVDHLNIYDRQTTAMLTYHNIKLSSQSTHQLSYHFEFSANIEKRHIQFHFITLWNPKANCIMHMIPLLVRWFRLKHFHKMAMYRFEKWHSMECVRRASALEAAEWEKNRRGINGADGAVKRVLFKFDSVFALSTQGLPYPYLCS